jgi:hypothetical protein
VNAVSIKLTRQYVGQISMPDPVRVLSQGEPMRFAAVIGGREQAELDLGRVFGEQGEIDPGSVPGGA